MSFSEWKEMILGDICQYISRGVTPSYTDEDGVVVLNQKCIRDNRVSFEQSRLTNQNKKKVSNEKYLKDFDVLVNSTGVGTLGRVAQIKKVTTPTTADSHITIVRANEKVNPQFLGYNLFMQQANIEALAEGSTGQTELSRTRLSEVIKVLLPPLPEQKAVAATLSCLDEKIELNNQINKILEEMAQAIFKNWFVDFEPFQDGEFEDSELGRIPKGWRVEKLGNVVDISTKSINPANMENAILEHYSIPAYDEGKMPVFENANEIKSNKYIVNKKCFLISKLNPSTKRYWKPYCISKNAVCSTEFIVYSSKDGKYLNFYYLLMDESKFYNLLISNTTGSTNSRQRAIPHNTLNFKFVCPPNNVIEDFVNIVDKLFSQIERNILENQPLYAIRDSLLPKLMSGEIRVPIEEVQ